MNKFWAKISLIVSPIFIALLVLDWFGLIESGMFFRNPFLFWINDTFLLVFYSIVTLMIIGVSILTLLEPEPTKSKDN